MRLLGRIGDDAAAEFLGVRLRVEDVQAQGLESVRGCSTSLASVVVDGRGARQIRVRRGQALAQAHPLDVRSSKAPIRC